jgi:hypothetical protein
MLSVRYISNLQELLSAIQKPALRLKWWSNRDQTFPDLSPARLRFGYTIGSGDTNRSIEAPTLGASASSRVEIVKTNNASRIAMIPMRLLGAWRDVQLLIVAVSIDLLCIPVRFRLSQFNSLCRDNI